MIHQAVLKILPSQKDDTVGGKLGRGQMKQLSEAAVVTGLKFPGHAAVLAAMRMGGIADLIGQQKRLMPPAGSLKGTGRRLVKSGVNDKLQGGFPSLHGPLSGPNNGSTLAYNIPPDKHG